MSAARPHATGESGFSLLELLLAIGVTAIMFMGITQVTRSWINKELADSAGSHMNRVASVVERYIEANWIDGTGSLLPETANALTDGDPLWADLPDILEQEGLMTAGTLRTPLGANLRIAYVVDTAGATTVYRASIFTETNLPNSAIRQAARKIGATGGTVSSFPDVNSAVGAFGQWSVAVGRIMPGGAAFPCARTNERGCLIVVVSKDDTSLCGPFLYRGTAPACTAANTMFTTLDMNNQDITNAATIGTEDLNVNQLANLRTTNVGGTATFNGMTTMAAGLDVNNGMDVSGDANFSNNVTMDGGTLNATTLNATRIDVSSIDTNTLNAQDMTIANGNLTVDDNVSINGNMSVAGPGAQAFVSTMNAGAINAGNGEIYVSRMNVINTMEISGAVNITSGTIISDQLVADSCVRINNGGGAYENYGICP